MTYRDQVREYYDAYSDIYLKHMGKTFQCMHVMRPGENFNALIDLSKPTRTDLRENNLYLAERAGIGGKQRLLDAGCGACGPSIDIAGAHPEVLIDAVTISPVGAEQGRKLVAEANLSDRVRVHAHDYHHLPFAEETYDLAFFFESANYSDDVEGLCREAFRVLKPGGRLYIKDCFRVEGEIDEKEARVLQCITEMCAHNPQAPSVFTKAMAATGFVGIEVVDLNDQVSLQNWEAGLVEMKNGQWQWSAFYHHMMPQVAEVFAITADTNRLWGGYSIHEIYARKPERRS